MNLRSPLPLPRPHQSRPPFFYGHNPPAGAALAAVDPWKSTRFHKRFRPAVEEITKGLYTSRVATANGHWSKWATFCRNAALTPLLASYRDPVPILNAFTREYRTGAIDPIICQVQYCTVENSVQSIGEALAALGSRYPRLTSQREMDIRLCFQFQYYSKKDSQPSRVNTTPLQVLCYISSVANVLGKPVLQFECDTIIVAYSPLICLGDYTNSKSGSTPLHLEYVALNCGCWIFATNNLEADLQATTFLIINFTTQKNGAREERTCHKTSWDPPMCPKYALLWRFLHLRANNTPSSTPLACVMTPTGLWKNRTPRMIYRILKTAVNFCGPNTVFEAKDVSAQSLCSESAMVILCAGVNSNIIKLISCCCIDEMLRYLHVQAKPIMMIFSKLMRMHVNYSFLPQQEVVCLKKTVWMTIIVGIVEINHQGCIWTVATWGMDILFFLRLTWHTFKTRELWSRGPSFGMEELSNISYFMTHQSWSLKL